MWGHLYIRYRLLRMQARRWLERHPAVDRVLRSSGALDTEGGAISRGVAVGLFVALLPLFGLQTLLIALGCVIVRGNFLVGFAVSWVNNPLTVTPLFVAFNVIGEELFGPMLEPLVDLTGMEREVVLEIMFLAAGSVCVAIPAAVLGYAAARLAERRLAARRAARDACP
jgi:uncharacterized protein